MSNHDWIIIKNKQQIEWIREAWKYLNELLYLMRDNCKAWVSLIELEILAQEFMDASKKEGSVMKKREDTHKMAEANKAFAHYKW